MNNKNDTPLKKITLFNEKDVGGDFPEDLMGYIAFWQSHLNKIPLEFQSSAKLDISYTDFYGSTEVNVKIVYYRPFTDEELIQIDIENGIKQHNERSAKFHRLQEIQAEELRLKKELNLPV